MTTPTEPFGDPLELTTEELIRAIRDLPAGCDFCGKKTEPEELVPQSGGQWMCNDCWDHQEGAPSMTPGVPATKHSIPPRRGFLEQPR